MPLLFHLRAQSGVELDVEEAWVYWVWNGKIWRMEQHASKQEALEAAELSGWLLWTRSGAAENPTYMRAGAS